MSGACMTLTVVLPLWMARKIQAWWRGRKAGSAAKALMRMRRKKEAKLYVQTKQDNQERKKLKYRFKKVLGVADTLKTDVTYERDMQGVSLLSRPPKVGVARQATHAVHELR